MTTESLGDRYGVAVWSSAEWRAEAVSWIDGQLVVAGIERAADVEQPHLRPWSTVLRVPTARGDFFFKATGREVAFEPRLYGLLERVAPPRILVPIAIDERRGWLLLPDGGLSLGERLEGPELIRAMEKVLPPYAELQRDLAPHADEMLAMGVADMRPATMPARFDEALAAMRACIEHMGDGEHPDAARYDRVVAMRAKVVAWCDELADAPVAVSIDHNDLHAWNVLAGESGDFGSARFYDWGDGVVAHPFSTMLALGWIPGADDTQLARMRDAYLEVFTDRGSRSELIRTLELACRVGKIARALTWYRAISALGLREVDEKWLSAPVESMGSLLDDSYLGRA